MTNRVSHADNRPPPRKTAKVGRGVEAWAWPYNPGCT